MSKQNEIYTNMFVLVVKGPRLYDLKGWTYRVYDENGREMQVGPLIGLMPLSNSFDFTADETDCP